MLSHPAFAFLCACAITVFLVVTYEVGRDSPSYNPSTYAIKVFVASFLIVYAAAVWLMSGGGETGFVLNTGDPPF
jgi:hypothetical protein